MKSIYIYISKLLFECEEYLGMLYMAWWISLCFWYIYILSFEFPIICHEGQIVLTCISKHNAMDIIMAEAGCGYLTVYFFWLMLANSIYGMGNDDDICK